MKRLSKQPGFKKYMYMRPEEFKVYWIVTSPEEVLEKIKGIQKWDRKRQKSS